MAFNPLAWLKQKFAAPMPAVPRPSVPIATPDTDEETDPAAATALDAGTPAVPANRRIKPRINARAGTRALIIDDSPTIVAMLRKMLKQNGYQTLEAGTAEEGLDIARTLAPEIVFLDIVLPGMDGFAALRQLRRDPLTRDLPVIMISGNEQATEQFYVQRIGADDFMKKPFSRAELFARIEPLLDAERIPRRRAAVAS